MFSRQHRIWWLSRREHQADSDPLLQSQFTQKKAARFGRLHCQLGSGVSWHRGDRIRTCGILLPKQYVFLSEDSVLLVVDSVLAVCLRHELLASVTSCLTFLARLWHTSYSNMSSFFASPVRARQLGEALQEADRHYLRRRLVCP